MVSSKELMMTAKISGFELTPGANGGLQLRINVDVSTADAALELLYQLGRVAQGEATSSNTAVSVGSAPEAPAAKRAYNRKTTDAAPTNGTTDHAVPAPLQAPPPAQLAPAVSPGPITPPPAAPTPAPIQAPVYTAPQPAPAPQQVYQNAPVAAPAAAVQSVMQPGTIPGAAAVVSAPPNGGGVAADRALVDAKSFREVMQWMYANGYKTVDAIAQVCEQFRHQVPTLAKLPGDLRPRVERAHTVMQQEQTAGA
jgi:hypothetical protein